MSNSKTVICIGDIHGYISKLQKLWTNLETVINPSRFNTATVIFLGDYCDRGPHTREVIDFLISLPAKYPQQKHVFLCGNHDLAFAAFIHCVPKPADGTDFKEGWKEYALCEEREGWFKEDGYEDMYLQGRRWAGDIKEKFNVTKGVEYQGSIYDAAPTFLSYGVPHGSAGQLITKSLLLLFLLLCVWLMESVVFVCTDLVKAVPDEHKKFLTNLDWIYEEVIEIKIQTF